MRRTAVIASDDRQNNDLDEITTGGSLMPQPWLPNCMFTRAITRIGLLSPGQVLLALNVLNAIIRIGAVLFWPTARDILIKRDRSTPVAVLVPEGGGFEDGVRITVVDLPFRGID